MKKLYRYTLIIAMLGSIFSCSASNYRKGKNDYTRVLVETLSSVVATHGDDFHIHKGSAYSIYDSNNDGILDRTPRSVDDPLYGVLPGPIEHIGFKIVSSGVVDGYVVDDWKMPVRIDLSVVPPVVYSVGPDGINGNNDDVRP